MTNENAGSAAGTVRLSRRRLLSLSTGIVGALSGCQTTGNNTGIRSDVNTATATNEVVTTTKPDTEEPITKTTDKIEGISLKVEYGLLQGEGEHCKVSKEVLQSLGVGVGQQVRIGCENCGDYPSGLYTVVDSASAPKTVQMSDAGVGRIGFSDGNELWIDSRVPHPEYQTVSEAETHSEFVEVIDDTGGSDLVVCAPHGGYIEHPTHEMSRYVAEELGVTEWTCAGYNSGGGAFDRWHITSTDISRHSFPGLDRIADRGFSEAVSFHGFTGSGIKVGGLADNAKREAMKAALDDRLGEMYEVTLANPAGPDGGASAGNFVNWLTENGTGIQLEIEWDARQDDWESIARAVVDFYEDRLSESSALADPSA